jgi:hypothetical protein
MPFLDRFPTALGLARGANEADEESPSYSGAPEVRRLRQPFDEPSTRLCGAAGCTSGWMKPWKSRRRPIFENEWGCSARCLGVLVAQAVRREAGETFETKQVEEHRHRVPLGLVLLAQGWITHPQLQSALAAQRAAGRGRIGEWLIKSCRLPEERVARGLGVQWSSPLLNLEGFSPSAMALVMPKRFVAEFGLVPIRVAGGRILYVAFQESPRPPVALGLEQMCGLKVETGLLTATHFEAARAQVMKADSVPVRLRVAADVDRLTAAIVRLLEQRQPIASRLVRMQNYFWLRLWLEEDALTRRDGLPASTDDMEDHVFLMG